MRIIPFVAPDIRDEDFLAVAEVLKSGHLNEGPVTEELEDKFARYIGVRHAITTTSGTMALTLIFHALSAVYNIYDFIIPSMTFVATANAVGFSGGVARIVDSIENYQTASNQGLVTVHLGGSIGLLPKHSFLVEDACHALGSEIITGKWRTVRDTGKLTEGEVKPDDTAYTKTVKAGRIGCAAAFSFQSEKLIGIGQGGMVTTNDTRLALQIQAIKSQGRMGRTDKIVEGGFNAKITDYQATLALCQLNRLNEQIAHRLDARLHWMGGAVGDCEIIPIKRGEIPLFTRLSFPSKKERNSVFDMLLKSGIESRKPYVPLHMLFKMEGVFSRASVIFETELWLPNHRLITDQESETLQQVLKECL